MKKVMWAFILVVAAADIGFTCRFRNSIAEWESNPVAVWVLCHAGLAGMIGYRIGWLVFAGALAARRSRLGKLLTPTWAGAHLYLLMVLILAYPNVAALDAASTPVDLAWWEPVSVSGHSPADPAASLALAPESEEIRARSTGSAPMSNIARSDQRGGEALVAVRYMSNGRLIVPGSPQRIGAGRAVESRLPWVGKRL